MANDLPSRVPAHRDGKSSGVIFGLNSKNGCPSAATLLLGRAWGKIAATVTHVTVIQAPVVVEDTEAGTNTRRVRRALMALFGGAVSKDMVSRTWRKVKGDWDAWNTRSLVDEPIVRLILDGTVVRVRLDRKATAISLLVVIGVRADGQKVLLAVKAMGGESAEVWRSVLDDLVRRGLRRPAFLIPAFAGTDGSGRLDAAIATVWDDVRGGRDASQDQISPSVGHPADLASANHRTQGRRSDIRNLSRSAAG
jgi:hypothetical protein